VTTSAPSLASTTTATGSVATESADCGEDVPSVDDAVFAAAAAEAVAPRGPVPRVGRRVAWGGAA
jgi:hypothetical protein